jgi:hypothetical protein
MDEGELSDIKGIARAVNRLDAKVSRLDDQMQQRMDKLERIADTAMGAINLAKWFLGFVGAAGVATMLYVLSQASRAT